MSGRMSLGKGFDVLMPTGGMDSVLAGPAEGERIQKVLTSDLCRNEDQPRHVFDQTALEELAESIGQYGILQPLIVSPAAEQGKFMIIAGERRWRAAQIAKIEKVPVIVRTEKELERLEIALVENIQRVDLSPLEQAASIRRLHDQFSLSYDHIAKKLGKAVPTVNNIVRLLNLTPAAQQALQEEKITEGHARSILALKDFPEQQEELLLLVQKNGWSVRQAEQFVVATKSGAIDTRVATKRTRSITPETEKLSKMLKRPVSITHTAKGGKLAIKFTDDKDLDELVELLGSLH